MCGDLTAYSIDASGLIDDIRPPSACAEIAVTATMALARIKLFIYVFLVMKMIVYDFSVAK